MLSNLLQHFHRKFIICILILFVLESKQANAAALKSGDSDQHCGGITSTQSCVFSYRTVEFGRFRSIVFLLLCCLLQPPYPLLHIFSIPPRWLFLRARWIPHFSPSELSLLHTQLRLALKMRLSRTWGSRWQLRLKQPGGNGDSVSHCEASSDALLDAASSSYPGCTNVDRSGGAWQCCGEPLHLVLSGNIVKICHSSLQMKGAFYLVCSN